MVFSRTHTYPSLNPPLLIATSAEETKSSSDINLDDAKQAEMTRLEKQAEKEENIVAQENMTGTVVYKSAIVGNAMDPGKLDEERPAAA